MRTRPTPRPYCSPTGRRISPDAEEGAADGLHAVQRQLLLRGTDAAGARRRGALAATDIGDGGGADGPCLAHCGVVKLSIRPTEIGHDPLSCVTFPPSSE